MTQKIYTTYVELDANTYYNCQTINQVDLMQTPWVNNCMWSAFENCYNLHTVTNIEQNVTNMQAAFMNCQNLEAAPTLPTQTTTLNSCFYGCSNITTMPTIPSNVADMSYSFMYCNKLNTLTTIPPSVNDICYGFAYTNITSAPVLPQNLSELIYTFAFCNNLASVPEIPANVTNMEGTFQGCKTITTAPNLPINVEDLSYTFSGCNNITAAPEIPNSVRYLDETFKDCTALTGDIYIKTDNIVHDITAINTFDNTSLHKNVYIPPVWYNDPTTPSETYNAFIEAGYDELGTKDGVYLMYNYMPVNISDWETSTTINNTIILDKYIGTNTTVNTPHNDWYSNKVLNTSNTTNGPFANNRTINIVDLAEVDVINNDFSNAFYSCYNLTAVTNINQNITNLANAFSQCTTLSQIPNIPPNVTNLVDTYRACWCITTPPTIPNTVTNMYSTFHSCTGLTDVPAIPDSVTNTAQTFAWCYNLNNINFIANNTTDTYMTFALTSLQSANVNIPNSLNTMMMFTGCNKLTDLNISAPKTTNVLNTFRDCNALTNVNAEFNSLTNITNLFADKYQLERVNITAPNATNASRIFNNCNCITTVNWNIASNADITWAFTGCSNLITVPDLPANTISLYRTFHGCISLPTLPTIPNSVTSLEYAFVDCKSITNSPVIPNGVTDMGATFLSCTNLATAPVIPNSVTRLAATFMGTNIADMPALPNSIISMSDCFHDCPQLVNVTNIPNSVQYLSQTFFNCQNLTGNIYIHSNQISDASLCFYHTSLIKNVYIPFEYENGVNTTTRNSFEAAYPINTISGTTIGTLTDNNGIISGFSASNYIRFPELTLGNNFEFGIKFTYIPTSASYQDLVRLEKRLAIAVHTANNNVIHFNTGDGSSWLGTNYDGITPLVSGNTYWIKIIANSDNTWQSYVSANDIDYNLESSGTFISQPTLSYYLGTDDGDFSRWFNGSIDLKECYIKVNGQKVWKGYVRPNGVVLKDIDGSKITIHPTPATATVLMYSTANGKEIDETVLNKFTYVKTNDDVLINGLKTQDTEIIVPSAWTETNSMRSIDGSTVYYKVYKEGYTTVEGQIVVDNSQDINVNLEQIMCTYTVIPIPADATVTFTASTGTQYYAWGPYRNLYVYTLSETPIAGDKLFEYDNGEMVYSPSSIAAGNVASLSGNEVINEYGYGYERNSSEDIIIGPAQVGNSITVPWGTEVSYTVSKTHYTSITNTEVVKTTGDRYVSLVVDKHTFTITTVQNDTAIQILVNGRLANSTDSDWIVNTDNLNNDVELLEYIGSNTTVVIPTSFTTTNTVTADYGSTIEYKVSKDGYKDVTGTLTLTQDTTITVDIGDTVNVSDYEYTFENTVLTLTKYIGSGGDIETPLIEKVS